MQPDLWKDKIAELQVEIDKLKKKKVSLAERLENLKVENKDQNSDTFNAAMVNQELSSLLKMQEIINQKLEQLNFETKQDVYRISQHDRAGVPKVAVEQQAAQIHGRRAGGHPVPDARAVPAPGDQGGAGRRPGCPVHADAVGGLCPAAAADGAVDPQAERLCRRTTRSSNSSSGSTTCGSPSAATRRSWRRGDAC